MKRGFLKGAHIMHKQKCEADANGGYMTPVEAYQIWSDKVDETMPELLVAIKADLAGSEA